MEEKNSCRINEGRLMEIDVASGYQTVRDVDEMIAMIGREFGRVPETTRIVIVADWRPCRLFTEAVAERAVKMLLTGNLRVERSAILHRSTQPTSVLQVFRLVKEAHFDNRKGFTQTGELEAWLGEILGERERIRLRSFLGRRH